MVEAQQTGQQKRTQVPVRREAKPAGPVEPIQKSPEPGGKAENLERGRARPERKLRERE